jgi:tetratricopeptide (TPR) repeat protein
MNQNNNSRSERFWEVMRKHTPWLEELITVFPSLQRFRVLLIFLAIIVGGGCWQWERISKIGPVAEALSYVTAKRLPEASPRRFSVAVAHIEADSNNDIENLVLESLKGIQGVELLRFDRKSDILIADRPLEAEITGHIQARSWLKSGNADLAIWGYVLPTKEKNVRIFITPRLTDEKFEAKMPADQSLDFPVKAGQALAGAVQAQVLAYLGQFDPSRDIAKDLKASMDKLSDLIEHWPDGREKVAMLVALANTHHHFSEQVGDMNYLRLAIKEYRSALQTYSNKDDVISRTMVRNFLGGALRGLGDQDIRYTRDAVSVYQDALREISREDTPEMWASVQSNLGIALHVLGVSERKIDLLRQAVEAQRSALTEVTQDMDGINWALMEVSLGNSLTSLGQLTQEQASFRDAITAYQNALLELPRRSHPLYWAMIKCNQGVAQMHLATELKDEKRLIEADNAFAEALQEYGRETAPIQFGMVKHNQAIIEQSRFKLTGDIASLKTSVRLFDEALQTRTVERSRVGWAETQYMLGYALVDLALYEFDETILNRADGALRSAMEVFDRKSYPQRAEELENRIRTLPKLKEFIHIARSCLEAGQKAAETPTCQRFLKKNPENQS